MVANVDKSKNIIAINDYLSFKGIFKERKRWITTNIEAFNNDIPVFFSEVEIVFGYSKCNDLELSFNDIEYTQLWEVLNRHKNLNSNFQCFSFEADRLIVTDPQNKSMKIVVY